MNWFPPSIQAQYLRFRNLFPQRRHPRSLLFVLAIPVTVQLLSTTILVSSIVHRSGQTAVVELSKELASRDSGKVIDLIDSYQLRAEEVLQQHLSLVQSGLVSLDNLIQFHRYLILHHPQEPFISALSIGTAKGEFRSSIRASADSLQQFPLQPEETPYRAIITHGKEPGLDRVYAIAQNGQPGRYLFSVKSHDVRHRPWYRRAAETREIGWTEPYPIGSSSGLEMSVSIPIYGFKSASSLNQPVVSPNNPVAVLSNTIRLDSLSSYLHAIAGKRVIYIIDSQGLMIANSLQEPVTHVRKQSIHQRDGRIPAMVRRLSVQDMESPTLTQSNQEMKQLIPNWQNLQISSTLTVNINQQRQFLSIFPNRSHGRKWFVVVITPEAELAPLRGTDSWWIGVVAVLNLAFMVGMVWFLSQQVVKKVSQIQQGLGAIANGQLDYRINSNQAIQELEQIVQSINQMAEQLHQSNQRLMNQLPGVVFHYFNYANGTDAFVDWGDFHRELFGMTTGSMTTMADLATVLHPNDWFQLTQAMEKCKTQLLESPQQSHELTHEFPIFTPHGTWKWIKIRANPTLLNNGDIQWDGFIENISTRKDLEASLREREAEYWALLSSLPDLICIYDSQGYYVKLYANHYTGHNLLPPHLYNDPNIRQLILPGRQTPGIHVTDFLPPSIATQYEQGIHKTLSTGQVQFIEQQFPVGDKIQYEEVRLIPFTSGQVLALVRDVSIHKQTQKILHQTQDELKSLIDNSPLAVIVWDQEFRVRKWSPQAEELFGWAEPEVLGKKFTDWQFLVEDEISQTMEYLKPLELGEGVICQNHNYRKDGTLLWCEWFNSAIKDESGRVVTVLSMAQDISVLKQTQQALEAAKELAEGANQSKSTFLANFSHEFRTPLHIILGYVQKIQKHPTCNQLFNSELKAIYTQGTYLFNLFQDLLELSKAESGRQTVNPTSCPLIELLGSLHSIFVNRAAAKGLILQAEYEQLPAYVSVDGSKLQQVLINLLTNAIKFTHQGQIVLKVNHQTHQASNTPQLNFLNFQLTDTGVGIAPEDISGLFEPFIQGKAGRHQGGSGLGLAICQRLIRLMGGDITITSQVGIGTTVGFYLPVGIIPENGSVEINSDFSQSGLTGLIDCSEQPFMEITPSIDWNSLRSQLGHFPSPWLQELYRLAMRGSDDKIVLLVNPVTYEYPELSSWLIQMAQNYDFDGILNLVQPLVNNS